MSVLVHVLIVLNSDSNIQLKIQWLWVEKSHQCPVLGSEELESHHITHHDHEVVEFFFHYSMDQVEQKILWNSMERMEYPSSIDALLLFLSARQLWQKRNTTISRLCHPNKRQQTEAPAKAINQVAITTHPWSNYKVRAGPAVDGNGDRVLYWWWGWRCGRHRLIRCGRKRNRGRNWRATKWHWRRKRNGRSNCRNSKGGTRGWKRIRCGGIYSSSCNNEQRKQNKRKIEYSKRPEQPTQ